MGLPRQLPPQRSGSLHGPFAEKAFKGALLGCVVLVIVGLWMISLGGDAPRSVGTSFVVLGALGLLTGVVGLLAERILQRHAPPPPDVRRRNGSARHQPDLTRIDCHPRE